MSVKKTFVFSRTKPEDPYVIPPLQMFHINISDVGQVEVIDSRSNIVPQYFNFRGGTVANATNFLTTISSGGTNLSSLFAPYGAGGDIFTGGTIYGATNFTSTISSGGTDLNNLFQSKRVISAITNSVTAINNYRYMASASTGNISIALPAASTSQNFEVVVKKTDSSDNSVIITSSSLVDGATATTLTSQFESVTLNCDGLSWYII